MILWRQQCEKNFPIGKLDASYGFLRFFKDSGHNHLLFNRMPVAAGESVPFDDNHKHFGAGQTEAMITLPPGQYKLTSQFANGAHQFYGTRMSATVLITVK